MLSIIEGISLTGIDYSNPLILIHPAEISSIIAVDMAVNHVTRLIFSQQSIEDLEPSVGRIFPVMKSTDGRVGQKDVKTFMVEERKCQSEESSGHFFLCVLIQSLIVFHTSAKS